MFLVGDIHQARTHKDTGGGDKGKGGWKCDIAMGCLQNYVNGSMTWHLFLFASMETISFQYCELGLL